MAFIKSFPVYILVFDVYRPQVFFIHFIKVFNEIEM